MQMSNSVSDETSRPPALTEVDLEDLVEEVVKSCWSKGRGRQRADALGEDSRGEVAILLDVRLRHSRAVVDVGGLKRVLFNIIGNSLKVRPSFEFVEAVRHWRSSSADLLSSFRSDPQFTDHGSITITLLETEAVPGVSITVADTGRGMSGELLPCRSLARA
jgi:signal transduction histidine kinase